MDAATPVASTSRVGRLLGRLTPSGSKGNLAGVQSPALSDVDVDLEPPQFVSAFMRELSDVEMARSNQRRASPPTGIKRSGSLVSSPTTASSSPYAASGSRLQARHSEDGASSSMDWSEKKLGKRDSVGSFDGERKSVISSTWNRSKESLGLVRTKSRQDLAEPGESSKTPGPSSWSRASRPPMSRNSSEEGLPAADSHSHRTPGAGALGAGLSESSKRFRSAFRLKSRDQNSTLRKPMRARPEENSMSEEQSSSPETPDDPDTEPDSSPQDENAGLTVRSHGSLGSRYRASDAASLARAQLVDEDEPPRPARTPLDSSRDTLRAPKAASRPASMVLEPSDRIWADPPSRPSSRNSIQPRRPSSELAAAIERSTRSPSPPIISASYEPEHPPRPRSALGEIRRSESRASDALAALASRKVSPPPPQLATMADSNENAAAPAATRRQRSFQTLEDRVPLADLGARMHNVSLSEAHLGLKKETGVVNEYKVPIKGGSVSPPDAPRSAASVSSSVPALTVAAPDGIAQPAPVPSVRKPSHSVAVNGKTYLRSALLGKGGSSRVYRITDRDHNVFALKRVELGKGDLETYHSFCNEIELLKRLRGHDRIIQLVDSEVNEAKRTLVMVMEIGEIDLNLLLQERASARVSMNFIRYMWEQMLEAVKVVHDAGIVHTDLKPANFVLVKGALKLIDFGIAKAIPSDTTNIARDQQIGTANYMSPEALSDSGLGRTGERMMKMGRASDVWSLGCILYQMVYGNTPFGQIRNLQQKMLAIQNPMHQIEFGDYAIPSAGGVEQHALATPVEADLVKVLKSCLRFEAKRRATIPELLEDDFLRRETRRDLEKRSIDPQTLSEVVSRAVRWSSGRQPTRAEQQAFVEDLLRHVQ